MKHEVPAYISKAIMDLHNYCLDHSDCLKCPLNCDGDCYCKRTNPSFYVTGQSYYIDDVNTINP